MQRRIVLGGIAASGVAAAAAADTPSAVPVEVPNARRFDIAGANGGQYRLMVAVPPGPAPAAGFPVLYHLDGNAVFGSLVDAVRLQTLRGTVTGVAPGIVVGIGYPIDGPFDHRRRTLDYTPPAAPENLAARPDGSPWPPTGGAAAFLEVIETQVKPLVAGLAPVDPARQALFGHSFGGLFALTTLFAKPSAFARIAAISPSLWWDGAAMMERLDALIAGLPPARPEVFVAVGGDEEPAQREGESPDAVRRRAARMVTRARDFATRLPGTEFRLFPGENHGSVVHAAIGPALRFALPATA